MALPDIDPQLDPEVLPPGEEDGYPGYLDSLTSEKLLSIINNLEGMSDEDRDQLREQLLSSQMGMGMGMGMPVVEQTPFSTQAAMLLSLLAVVAFIFVFFGYKLYKSLKEKEKKRDEKRKMKQLKKKK